MKPHDIVMNAFNGLYPGQVPNFSLSLRYSAKFSAYNANVRHSKSMMRFSLSRNWASVSPEIQIGLIQALMLKVLRDRKTTINIDMYHIFLKKVHAVAPRTFVEPVLADSFNRVNSAFFDSMVSMPNLMFSNSVRKLGSYEYGSDTLKISRLLADEPELMDYVMHHELLHKRLKFRPGISRTYHHTAEFRQKEREFPGQEELEARLARLVRRRRWFGF